MLEPNYHRTPLLRSKVVISDLCILWVLLIIYDSERSNLNKRSTKQGPDTSESIISARGYKCPKKGRNLADRDMHQYAVKKTADVLFIRDWNTKLRKDAEKRCESDKDDSSGGQRLSFHQSVIEVHHDVDSPPSSELYSHELKSLHSYIHQTFKSSSSTWYCILVNLKYPKGTNQIYTCIHIQDNIPQRREEVGPAVSPKPPTGAELSY
ncbi:hypothetical protein KQX54_012332 [Cotesia glomerata]|uniref:Uncharacterized protein n=1 Tax=Cotesia glomerata TaxID=32391 RepID=A0AAV7IMQ5_COTGL|nr:hypothetical protein KQX54_012332 [Cotesia glomerata]